MPDVHVTQSALAVFLIVGAFGVAAALGVVFGLVGARRRPARRGQGLRDAAATEKVVDDEQR